MTEAKPRVCCNQTCTKTYFSQKFSGAGNPAYGKAYRSKATHPDWAASISTTHKQSDRMLGDNNPMRRPEVAARMGQTRHERFENDPQFREQHAEQVRQAWARGDYDGIAVGKCKWYAHVKPDGTTVKLQGTWEVAFARWLDAQGLTYDTHKGRWPYTALDGTERSYYPDFYVHDWHTAVDVKGAFWDDEQATKLDYVRASNPSQPLLVANKQWLEEHGVDYISVQRELLAANTPETK